jgi:hypothetical protein
MAKATVEPAGIDPLKPEVVPPPKYVPPDTAEKIPK